MALYPKQFINLRGIPTIESTGVTVGTDAVTFLFRATAAYDNPFRGLLLVKLGQSIPSDTTTTLPIVFSSDAGTLTVGTYDGTDLTVSDWKGTGVYLLYYDRLTGTLQLIA